MGSDTCGNRIQRWAGTLNGGYSSMKAQRKTRHNGHGAAGKSEIALLFHIGCTRLALPEHDG
jgi:hypothetical protein